MEAETIRAIFRLYLKLGNVRKVKQEADRLGLRTKLRRPNNGSRLGGVSFTRGHIYKILSNPIYIGKIAHKGETFEGKHDGIVDVNVWDQVQAHLKKNAVERKTMANVRSPCLLAGLLFDSSGVRLTPNFACKGNKRYRYYVSARKADRKPAHDRWRLPAAEIEQAVLNGLSGFLRDQNRLASHIAEAIPVDRLAAIGKIAAKLGTRLLTLSPTEKRAMLRTLLARVIIDDDNLRLVIRLNSLMSELGAPDSCRNIDRTINLDIPLSLKKRGIGIKLIFRGSKQRQYHHDAKLIEAVAKGHKWFEQLKTGEIKSVSALAKHNNTDRTDIGRTLPLAFLAPDIVAAILAGEQPLHLNASRLKRGPKLPLSWNEQRAFLGFTH